MALITWPYSMSSSTAGPCEVGCFMNALSVCQDSILHTSLYALCGTPTSHYPALNRDPSSFFLWGRKSQCISSQVLSLHIFSCPPRQQHPPLSQRRQEKPRAWTQYWIYRGSFFEKKWICWCRITSFFLHQTIFSLLKPWRLHHPQCKSTLAVWLGHQSEIRMRYVRWSAQAV